MWVHASVLVCVTANRLKIPIVVLTADFISSSELLYTISHIKGIMLVSSSQTIM